VLLRVRLVVFRTPFAVPTSLTLPNSTPRLMLHW
jgi:hypothetical protein